MTGKYTKSRVVDEKIYLFKPPEDLVEVEKEQELEYLREEVQIDQDDIVKIQERIAENQAKIADITKITAISPI